MAGPALETYPGFAAWLAESKVALAFTTYEAQKLLFLGQRGGRLVGFERTFNRCMGLWGSAQTMWMATTSQIVRLENVLRPGQVHEGYDRLYVPKVAHTTADLDVHELVVEASGRVVFANTKFSCLSTLSDRYSFTPLWKPPFITKDQPADACHMNGIALEKGKVRYVTVIGRTDSEEGWRQTKRDGGCILKVPSGEPVITGLSMPHSPRVYKDRLWLCNSGTGQFGHVDRDTGKFVPLTFCPGYARGVAFVGDRAVIGLSQAREKGFRGLQLDEELATRDVKSRCGLLVVDLGTGEVKEWATFHSNITELFDVVVLPGVAQPMALGYTTDDIQRMVFVGDAQSL